MKNLASGDGDIEIYVLTYGGVTSQLRTYTDNLQLLHAAQLSVRATNLILEPSTSTRKNLLISMGTTSYSYYATSASEIWAIDPVSGSGVWRSPGFPGDFSRESLHTVDVDVDGQYELSFGTNVGAFVSR